jgi:hypothetical protein
MRESAERHSRSGLQCSTARLCCAFRVEPCPPDFPRASPTSNDSDLRKSGCRICARPRVSGTAAAPVSVQALLGEHAPAYRLRTMSHSRSGGNCMARSSTSYPENSCGFLRKKCIFRSRYQCSKDRPASATSGNASRTTRARALSNRSLQFCRFSPACSCYPLPSHRPSFSPSYALHLRPRVCVCLGHPRHPSDLLVRQYACLFGHPRRQYSNHPLPPEGTRKPHLSVAQGNASDDHVNVPVLLVWDSGLVVNGCQPRHPTSEVDTYPAH